MFRQDYLIKVDNTSDIQTALEFSLRNKCSGIITSTVSEFNSRDLLNQEIALQKGCFTRSPLILSSSQWLNGIYPLIKISGLDSKNEEVRKNAELKLIQEFMYTCHIKQHGYHYIQPSSCDPEILGKFLVSQLSNANIHFVVEIQLFDARNTKKMYQNNGNNEYYDSWKYWNALHKATNFNPQIEVALVMCTDLPASEIEIYRWLGEPVSMLVVKQMSFMTNRANFPVLTPKQQEVLHLFFQYQKCFIVFEPKSIYDERVDNYIDYLKYRHSRVEGCNQDEDVGTLRYPLQPLYDNLDSSTYETFERDPAKYILYQKAVEEALKDLVSEEEKESKTSIILIVGAGRGPLIRACLNASENTSRKIKILAVEKNPNAIVTLSCLIRDLWADKEIELIAKDMRTIQLEENADIILSELLGSMGDNELSPECLNGVEHLLKPTGISIPSNSKSYLQPIMSKRTYGFIQKRPEDEGKKRAKYSEGTEINWLIYLTNVFHIDQAQELFTFVHPNKENPVDNTRYKKLTFVSSIECILHGFTGYFSSQLYKDIFISIVPENHTQGMGSWYSAYFPISESIHLQQGDKIELEFWRKLDSTKVWYEWKLKLPEESIVHNLNGEIHPILL